MLIPNSYEFLSDCPLFKSIEVEIWYKNKEFFAEGIMGKTCLIKPLTLSKTHVHLGTVTVSLGQERIDILENLFSMLQSENWSRNGEAALFIHAKKLSHTSMSVGDIIRFRNSETYFCGRTGWDILP